MWCSMAIAALLFSSTVKSSDLSKCSILPVWTFSIDYFPQLHAPVYAQVCLFLFQIRRKYQLHLKTPASTLVFKHYHLDHEQATSYHIAFKRSTSTPHDALKDNTWMLQILARGVHISCLQKVFCCIWFDLFCSSDDVEPHSAPVL